VPEQEHHNELLRVAVRELLTNVLLIPVLDKLTDPDFVTKGLILVSFHLFRNLSLSFFFLNPRNNRSSLPLTIRSPT